jgi:hypothetical protein
MGLVAISHQLLVLLHLAAHVACDCSGLYRGLFVNTAPSVVYIVPKS